MKIIFRCSRIMRCSFLFSQDVFIPTQSQEATQQSDKTTASLPRETQSQHPESAPFTLPLQLSVTSESSSLARQQTSEQLEDESQATQIEELEEVPGVDTSDAVILRCDQRSGSNGVPSESHATTSPKASATDKSPKRHDEPAETERSDPSNPSQKSDVHTKTSTSLNVQDVHAAYFTTSSPVHCLFCACDFEYDPLYPK